MTDHDTQDLTACFPCPYAEWEYVECHHPANGKPKDLTDGGRTVPHRSPPDWCPLRVRPVLVRLVVKETP